MALTEEQLTKLKETMYSRPLTQEEVYTIASTTKLMDIAYHSTSGGITFYDEDETEVILSLSGFGIKDTIKSDLIKFILDKIPTYAKWFYEMFAKGVLTLEHVDITAQVYKENYEHQPSLDDLPNINFTQFSKDNDGVYSTEVQGQ